MYKLIFVEVVLNSVCWGLTGSGFVLLKRVQSSPELTKTFNI